MGESFAPLLAGLLRPFGPAALLCLPLAALAGATWHGRSPRAWLLLSLALLLALFFADPTGMPRAPHPILRALCVAGVAFALLRLRDAKWDPWLGACALAACGYTLVEVPGPLRSLSEGVWPEPISFVGRALLAVGTAFTLIALAWICHRVPRSVARWSPLLLALCFVVIAAGVASNLMQWAIGHWPLPLYG